jgi:beta-glucanase (GH16 family)
MPSSPTPPPTATTSWSDEFNGPANSPPDSTRWTYDLGGGGWGNQELQTYTSLAENVRLDGQGNLVIRVLSTPSGITSARVKTQGRFNAQFGRIEARMRLPSGQGIWPAFWMLGADLTSVGWPACGEIDIMENIGREPSVAHGTVHGPGYSAGNAVSARYTLPGGQTFAQGFHVFAIQWASRTITFSVDGTTYATVTPSSLPAGAAWVFDKPFFMILNVAVGGTFPGNPDATTTYPQEMVVDYVRVS